MTQHIMTQHIMTQHIMTQHVIRKVNKQHAVLDVDEPVSQLHKCSLQFRDEPHAFLCLCNDAIVQYRAQPSLREPSRVVLSDGACWTSLEVKRWSFTFKPGSSLRPDTSQSRSQLSLFRGGGHVATLEVSGENFSPHLKVWFGNTEAETMFRSPKSLLCVVPDVSVFRDGWRSLRRLVSVPLALVRSDGLVYRTSFSFSYSPELHPPPSVRAAAAGGADGGADVGPDDDVLLESIHQEFTRANFHLFMQS
ncbi:recombining binding protein suppressor of hairless-like protein [Betta splendens]|uniref:Recombining binding protein suppressor of hairless-like protein n=1 Tax=Betta splendens TaxID=158456 RepID=A0A8M1HET9_BETSP|nr:recombining binding protein suppressor of hairless-like protein [Betta splendens]